MDDLQEQIATRIASEYRKHQRLDWTRIAAAKIVSTLKHSRAIISKDQFIADFLTRHMKNHGLPYGKEYLSLLEKKEQAAEKAWNKFKKKWGV